jgi:hypothetical protein
MRGLGVLLLLLLPSVAAADIYVWRDGAGVTHFTNSRKLLPADVEATVLLEEPIAPIAAAPAAPPPAEEAPSEETRSAVVIYDESALVAAFADGWQRGMATARQAEGEPRVEVRIQGPLVAGGGVNANVFGGDPYAASYAALVTTSFDRGRSRHQTLRMLMQDQFAVDRGGPYRIVNRFPPRSPNLATFLPRGLPLILSPGSRVITD